MARNAETVVFVVDVSLSMRRSDIDDAITMIEQRVVEKVRPLVWLPCHLARTKPPQQGDAPEQTLKRNGEMLRNKLQEETEISAVLHCTLRGTCISVHLGTQSGLSSTASYSRMLLIAVQCAVTWQLVYNPKDEIAVIVFGSTGQARSNCAPSKSMFIVLLQPHVSPELTALPMTCKRAQQSLPEGGDVIAGVAPTATRRRCIRRKQAESSARMHRTLLEDV